jgi:hypothetical protein
VHGYQVASRIINFLRESNRVLGRIHLFDVASTTTGAAMKFANISSAAILQFFPILKFSLVL